MRKHFCALGGASPHSGTPGKSAPRFGFTRQLGDAFHFTVTSAGVYTCRSRSEGLLLSSVAKFSGTGSPI